MEGPRAAARARPALPCRHDVADAPGGDGSAPGPDATRWHDGSNWQAVEGSRNAGPHPLSNRQRSSHGAAGPGGGPVARGPRKPSYFKARKPRGPGPAARAVAAADTCNTPSTGWTPWRI